MSVQQDQNCKKQDYIMLRVFEEEGEGERDGGGGGGGKHQVTNEVINVSEDEEAGRHEDTANEMSC